MPLSKVVSNSLSLTTLTSSGAGSIQGLTVGRGAGAVATNTAAGASALVSNTTGANGTAVGYQAGYSNTTASDQTFVGFEAGYAVTGANNTGFGRGALRNATTTSGSVALGRLCMGGGTVTGADNTGVGNSCLQALTSGGAITAVGSQALISNTSASNNTAVGYQAGYANTTGASCTFVGKGAGIANTTGSTNVFVGVNAGATNTTSGDSTYIGESAGNAATGAGNTFVGNASGAAMTTGARNTFIGTYQGNSGGLDLRTSSNHVVLSDGSGNVRAYFDSTGICRMEPSAGGTGVLRAANLSNLSGDCGIVSSLGSNCSNTSSYFFIGSIRGVADRIYIYGNGNIQNTNGSYGAFSDVKLKENIVDATPKLADLMQVRVRNYNLKSDPTLKQIGVVAQELETIFPALVDESPDRDEEGNTLETTTKSVKYSVFVPMLIKAIQEQQALITQQATAITTLTTRITALEQA